MANVTYAGFSVRGPSTSAGRLIFCVTDDNGLSATVYCTDWDQPVLEDWEAVPQDGADRSPYYSADDMIKAAMRRWWTVQDCSETEHYHSE